MKNLDDAWTAICDSSVRLDLPPSRWKHAWSTHELSAKRLHNAILWRQPMVIVETGTFEGLGTFAMAKAAHENGNSAKIFTIDYDGDPDMSIPMTDWIQLRQFRDENLDLARTKFPGVEIHFLNGDSRMMLPSLFPSPLERWDFFFQDSMHFLSGILAEWKTMRQFATEGSVVVFDDVCLDWKKMVRHLFKQDDFCWHFLLNEVWQNGWSYKSTVEGRAQFWAQKTAPRRLGSRTPSR
jgi:Methyltransferase domain